MRNFVALILALVLGFVGAMLSSYIPKEFTAYSQAIMGNKDELISPELANSNAVEVDGIRFEILVPERVWIIPANQPDAGTPVKLGIRITNSTQQPLRFTQFETIAVEIIAKDGYQAISKGGPREMGHIPKESEYLIAQPKQSVTLILNAGLRWVDDKLYLLIPDGFGGGSYFDNLNPGIYQLRFFYSNYSASRQVYNILTNESKILEDFWTGQVSTPAIEICIVQQ
ncbi:MAG TPA: hypothetical protein DCL61_28780 [Cyanobacteria bacterium UBA12227]|nr:hypothetical protein [Cyanobacteria bacterium UBA12227]HAX85949.1 hypothetical protein [Cyanobacteria bacterium UBA11370]HBY81335.1 hypothetical protein [Cyanobacteria bacterium UBA11148]